MNKILNEKTKNIINVILFILLIVFLVCFIITDYTAIKVLTSCCFVFNGLLFFEWRDNHNRKISGFLLAGLWMSLLGDLFIEINFVLGGAFFAIAHLMYLISYFSLVKINVRDILFGLCIFVISALTVLLLPSIVFDSFVMKVLCLIYTFLISLMTGKAANNFVVLRNRFTFFVFIGAVLFLFSDLMVFLNAFSPETATGNHYRDIGHLIYFPGQFILAQSIKYFKNNNTLDKKHI